MNTFIPISEPSITEKEISYVLNAITSGWVSSLGMYINEFEKKFAEYLGVNYALTTTNGTCALHLALVTLGIKEGDEVIVPDLTFIAVPNAVTYTGAKPVFVDVDTDTWCIDPEAIKRAVTSRTRALLPVHLYGHPADMEAINKIAQDHELYVIEDAAEAHGTEYKGKKVGSLGDVGVFSFYANKVITTGEGGMITTNDRTVYEKAKYLRDHAMSREKRYWHTEIGFNYRLTNLQAALGLAQLERIDQLIDKKREIFRWYREALGTLEGIRLNPEKPWAKNAFWMICLVMDKNFGISRDQLMLQLRDEGIDSRPFFYPMSSLPMYKAPYNGSQINPVAKEVSERGLNLPCSVNLSSKEVMIICKVVTEALKQERDSGREE